MYTVYSLSREYTIKQIAFPTLTLMHLDVLMNVAAVNVTFGRLKDWKENFEFCAPMKFAEFLLQDCKFQVDTVPGLFGIIIQLQKLG